MRWIIPALVMAVGCQAAPPPQGGPPPTPVKIDVPNQGVIREQSEYVARVESQQVATLRSQVSGQVRSLPVSPGERVNQGQVVVTLQAATQEAVVASRQAGVSAAQRALESARATLQSLKATQESRRAALIFAQELFERNQVLRAEGVIPQNTLDASQRDLRQAEANMAAIAADINAQKAAIARAESNLQEARADAEQAAVQLGLFSVVAPTAGRLGDLLVKVGDYVTPETALTTLRQEDGLDLVVAIPLERSPLLRSGLVLDLLDPQGQTFGQATTYFIAPQTDINSQSVLIRARVENGSQLRADQFVRVRVTWEERPGILLPITAISRMAGQSFVFVAQPNPENPNQLVAAQVPVQLGSLQGNEVHVVQGVEPGQQVVTSGVQKLFPNAPIVPDTAMPEQMP